MGAVGVGGAIIPFVSSMAPDARTIALAAPIEVDLNTVNEGDTVTFKWKGRPVFVRNRSQAEIDPRCDGPRKRHERPSRRQRPACRRATGSRS